MNIGIYPGTFDPVHKGHIGFACAAAKQCDLDKVIFLPEASPREKSGVSSLGFREARLQKATKPYKFLEIMTIGHHQFTVAKTLPLLEDAFPSARLTLLIGSDVVKTFDYRWPGLEELFSRMPLVIGLRADDTKEMIEDSFSTLRFFPRYHILDSPHPSATSSNIRKKDKRVSA